MAPILRVSTSSSSHLQAALVGDFHRILNAPGLGAILTLGILGYPAASVCHVQLPDSSVQYVANLPCAR